MRRASPWPCSRFCYLRIATGARFFQMIWARRSMLCLIRSSHFAAENTSTPVGDITSIGNRALFSRRAARPTSFAQSSPRTHCLIGSRGSGANLRLRWPKAAVALARPVEPDIGRRHSPCFSYTPIDRATVHTCESARRGIARRLFSMTKVRGIERCRSARFVIRLRASK